MFSLKCLFTQIIQKQTGYSYTTGFITGIVQNEKNDFTLHTSANLPKHSVDALLSSFRSCAKPEHATRVGSSHLCILPEPVEINNHRVDKVALVGLDSDKENQRENSRIGASVGLKTLFSQGNCNSIVLDQLLDAKSAAEGAFLCKYDQRQWATKNDLEKNHRLVDVSIAGVSDDQTAFDQGKILADAENFARDLANAPANLMTPSIFATTCKAKLSSSVVTEHDEKWALEHNMHAFLSVASGSKGVGGQPPRFLQVHYQGNTNTKDVDVVLVGKGVTFDSGGISIKPSNGMESMKADMGGAAAVVGTMMGVEKLGLPLNVSALVPLTENMPSGSATKPGDVVSSAKGTSIEVINTDAEGRLILADALHYAHTLRPKRAIIDVATLTGAMMVALGSAFTGVFTNADTLYAEMEAAGKRSGERVWRMPLDGIYTQQIKSKVADIQNIGGRDAGACTAAAFLQEFAEQSDGTPSWMHMDIAGVMETTETGKAYEAKGMSGKPTRTLLEYLIGLNN